jgi:hypothetical protein
MPPLSQQWQPQPIHKMTEMPIQEYLPSISEEHDEEFQELIDYIYQQEEDDPHIQYIMDIMIAQYDLILEKELADNPPIIGDCGFPCDGECLHCKGRGTFDITDEV